MVRRLIITAALGAALALGAQPAYAKKPVRTRTTSTTTSASTTSCTAPTTGYGGAVASTQGLVGYWRLGEASGTTACDSAGTDNGTYSGGYTLGVPGALSGDPDTAVRLDGSTGQVSVPDSSALHLGDRFSVEAWVKRNTLSTSSWQTIVSKQSGAWLIMFDSNDHLVLRRSTVGNLVASTVRVADNNWHQVAATKDGSSVHLYIDGQDVTGTVSNQTMADNTQPLVIGESSTTAFYNGAVDEVSVYNVALDSTQIKAHYDAATTSSTSTTSSPPPPTSGDPVIAAAGDIACDPNDPNFNNGLGANGYCHQQATSDLVVNTGLTGVLTLGDEQYDDGTLAKFQAVYDSTWGRANQLGHPGVGNHEYLTTAAQGYFDYFNGIGNYTGPAGPRDKGYYSFDIGTWHIIALNSNCSQVGGCGSGSPQETWLRQDLSAHPNKCTLAFWHHPRFSSGIVGNESAYSVFWNDLYNANADLVLDGHDHDYERFAPQTPGAKASSSRGIREFVVGTGGKSLKPFNVIQKNSQVRQSTVYGVLRLTLHPSSYDWQYVPEAGQSFTDSGTTSCH